MPLSESALRDALVKTKAIPRKDFDRVSKHAREIDQPLSSALLSEGVVTPEALRARMAEYFKVPAIDLSTLQIAEDLRTLVPLLVARRQEILPFRKDRSGIHVAMSDPLDEEAARALGKKTGETIHRYWAAPSEIVGTLVGKEGHTTETFQEQLAHSLKELEAGVVAHAATGEEAPIVRIVEALLHHAMKNSASDVHIEPRDQNVDIRFRIDGVLHDLTTLPKAIHELVVTRIKILGKLRTDEHLAAQDGKLTFLFEGSRVDVRVSIVPIVYGEKVVMRLLAQQGRGFSLERLPFSERDAAIIKRNIQKPWGMILATGPTGSGKTTTLYAILKVLNTRSVNISTIEDPVEYDIAGINQIQVNPRTNLTFAHGLRSILRQDPNIIMVGEIRDEETAQIAVNASLTGHLVLSTLHTNDAATTLPRLLDMGVEPFLIASTVNIAIGQRLVRALCPKCKKAQTIVTEHLPEEILHVLSPKARQTLGRSIKVFQAGGCTLCHQTGYESRIGVYEVLEMDETLRKLVMARATSDDIRTQSRASGMTTLVEDGMRKVIAGLTSVEEILRVTKE